MTWQALAVDPSVAAAAFAAWSAPACTGLRTRPARLGERPSVAVAIATAVPVHHRSDAAWTDLDSHPDTGAMRSATIALHPDHWRDLADAAQTALLVHEIGHALGLAHAVHRQTVMHPGLRDHVTLFDDDQHAVCTLFPRSARPAEPPDRPLLVVLALVLALIVARAGQGQPRAQCAAATKPSRTG